MSNVNKKWLASGKMLYKGRMRNNRVFSLLLNENFVVPYSSQTEKNYYSLEEGIEIAILLPKRALFTTSSSKWLFHYSKDKVSVIVYLQSLKKELFYKLSIPLLRVWVIRQPFCYPVNCPDEFWCDSFCFWNQLKSACVR